MDGQKEVIPPVATGLTKDLPTSAKRKKKLNPNAPEWFAKTSERDIHQSDGSL